MTPSAPEPTPAVRVASATAEPTPPERAAAASPAEQVEGPLVALATAPDGAQHLVVRLDPEALGSVQIHVERPKDGPARVAITVERSETLNLLLRDEGQLRQALDGAGIPPDGRSISFHVASPDAPRGDNATSGGLHAGGERTGDGGGSGARREASGGGGGHEPLPDRRPRLRWSRAGLDITA